MTADPTDPNTKENNTPLGFYFFIGALGLALLSALWMLFQMMFLS